MATRRNGTTAGTARQGITVVEMMVLIGLLAIALALLVKPLARAREAARRAQCVSYLKGLTLAIHNYESIHSALPPAGILSTGQRFDSFSVFARILPFSFSDVSPVYDSLNFEIPVSAQGTFTQDKVDHFLCPSDRNTYDRPLTPGVPFPTNYIVNLGTWKIYDPLTGESGDGPFGIGRFSRLSEIPDGTTHTIMLSEGAGFQATLGGGGSPADPDVPPPGSEHRIPSFGGTFSPDGGHASWASAQPLQTGFTTTFPPNTIVPYTHGWRTFAIDFLNLMPGDTDRVPSYAAITARSYHENGVDCGMMDGSVRLIRNSIDPRVWRALGTANGGEILTDDDY